jgi:F0F1-type ATP synthase beta subunit
VRLEALTPGFHTAAGAAGEQPAAGVVAPVHGVVIDVDFQAGRLPPISDALVIQRPSSPLVVEVHAHLRT